MSKLPDLEELHFWPINAEQLYLYAAASRFRTSAFGTDVGMGRGFFLNFESRDRVVQPFIAEFEQFYQLRHWFGIWSTLAFGLVFLGISFFLVGNTLMAVSISCVVWLPVAYAIEAFFIKPREAKLEPVYRNWQNTLNQDINGASVPPSDLKRIARIQAKDWLVFISFGIFGVLASFGYDALEQANNWRITFDDGHNPHPVHILGVMAGVHFGLGGVGRRLRRANIAALQSLKKNRS